MQAKGSLRGAAGRSLYQGWSLSGLSAVGTKSGITDGSASIYPRNFWMRPDGLRLYCGDYQVSGVPAPLILQYNLSKAWDITSMSASPDASYDASGDVTTAPASTTHAFTGFVFNSAGTKLITFYNREKYFYEFSLSTPWDLSTLTFVQRRTPAAVSMPPTAIFSSPDGKNLYLTGRATDIYTVFRYRLDVAFDLSNVNINDDSQTAFDNSGVESLFSNAWAISLNGEHAYLLEGNASHAVKRYDLASAFDIAGHILLSSADESQAVTTGHNDGIFVRQTGEFIYTADAGQITQWAMS